jgi:predicted acylesterase/phospholipase RssA
MDCSKIPKSVTGAKSSPDDDFPYNCLVVAGGASKCISGVGALHYLHIRGKLDFIEHYAGTSAGGMLCYFLAIGYTPFELIHFLCSSNFIDEFQNLNIAGVVDQKGLINYYIVQEYFEKLTINKIGYLPTFRDLRLKMGKNLTLVTYNLTKNKVEYLNADTYPEMSCLSALRMTINVPLLFERFFYNSCEYLDGGLVDNFPIGYYSGPEYKTIGININPLDASIPKRQNYIMYLLKIAMIPYIFFHLQKKYPENSTVVDIQTDIQTFDFNLTISKRLDLFSRGYQSILHFFEDSKESSDSLIPQPTEKALPKDPTPKDPSERDDAHLKEPPKDTKDQTPKDPSPQQEDPEPSDEHRPRSRSTSEAESPLKTQPSRTSASQDSPPDNEEERA